MITFEQFEKSIGVKYKFEDHLKEFIGNLYS